MKPLQGNWNSIQPIGAQAFRCGFCGSEVAANQGWTHGVNGVFLPVCPRCGRPTFLDKVNLGPTQVPGPKPGAEIANLPNGVEELYDEARAAMAVGAPTVAVLGFRKLLMHVAVEKGATAGQTFQEYVAYLETEHHVPSGAKDWVDHIRQRGNEANHEIKMMSQDEAQELLVFAEMLLRLVYEFPSKLPKKRQ